MSTTPRRVARDVLGGTVLLLMATTAFAMVTSGTYRHYLQEWFGPYLMAAAIVVGVLGLWTLLEAADRAENRDGAATHSHGVPKVGALLLVPVLLFAVASPSSLGAGAASDVVVLQRTSADPAEFPELPSDVVTEVSVLEFVQRYTFGDPTLLEGKPVRLLGFAARQTSLPEDQWSVNRFQIFCCVADASLYTVALARAEQPQGQDVWVEVEGVIDLDASDTIPVLTVSVVDVVAQPEEPYL